MKRMIRYIGTVTIASSLVIGGNAWAYSDSFTNTLPEIIEPCYVGLQSASCSLEISSGKATCTSKIVLYNNYTVSQTIRLQKSSDGKSWTTIKTWTSTSKSFEGNYYVSSGYKYRATLSANVYNSSGKLVDSVSRTSAIRP